jgi:hypothetical protein
VLIDVDWAAHALDVATELAFLEELKGPFRP